MAHKLAPGRQSPSNIDADGFRAVDGTLIDGHSTWVKILGVSTADVADRDEQLTRGCIVCFDVPENQFGIVVNNADDGWGDDCRAKWEYGTGRFELIGNGRWRETDNGGGTAQFVETRRRAEYIEIFDQSRDVGVRLYADKMFLKQPGPRNYEFFRPGRWIP